jgi:ABC-type transport system involved in multi-copper enzyme maturation permease subunit
LIKREFTSYFLSPIAYVVLTVFLLVTGHLLYLTTVLLTEKGPRGIEYPMQALLGDEKFWLVFLFIPPLLTMRSFAEERASGTLEMLLTAPLRDWQVVLAKYVACLLFYFVLWIPTLVYLPLLVNPRVAWTGVWSPGSIAAAVGLGVTTLAALAFLVTPPDRGPRGVMALVAILGVVLAVAACWYHYRREATQLIEIETGIDPYPVVTSYLGLAFAGGMFLALGLLVSSLVKSQMVSALVAMVFSLGFVLAAFWRPEMDPSGSVYRLLYFFSVPLHFQRDFARGQLDTRNLVLYGSVALGCLFFTVRSLESRRWR